MKRSPNNFLSRSEGASSIVVNNTPGLACDPGTAEPSGCEAMVRANSEVRTILKTNDPAGQFAKPNGSHASSVSVRTLLYFILTVLGFSFWFFMAVPFATHREGYSWLATVRSHPFSYAFLNHMSVTYRPLGQAAGWLGVLLLDPRVFPTSVPRQALLQGFVYGTFVLAWWLMYRAAAQRRLFALVAFVAGGVFFSGYVHLFHIYGVMYSPVVLTLGGLLLFHASGAFGKREVWFAVAATILAFWHPFATALFVSFYFGFCLETFRQRNRTQRVRALLILLVAGAVALGTGLIFARHDAEAMSLHTRLLGFLVSYRTNEINLVASLVAFGLTQLAVLSMGLSSKLKVAGTLLVCALSAVFLAEGLPLLLLWVAAVLIKLLRSRSWSLLFLTLTAALLPFGGGIGSPVFALFAVILAVYVTPLGWPQGEKTLSFLTPRYAGGAILASIVIVLMVRAGIEVPIVTKAATPLLTERERTYQLEHILAWLHNSDYCGDEVAFAEDASSPVYDVEGAITRRHRPPTGLEDVQFFWNTLLRCHTGNDPTAEDGTATVTFGGSTLAGSRPVFEVVDKYAGSATVWIRDPRKVTGSSGGHMPYSSVPGS